MNDWIVPINATSKCIDFEKIIIALKTNRLYRFRRLDQDNLEKEIDAITKSYLYAPTFETLNDPMEAFFGVSTNVYSGDSLQEAVDHGTRVREQLAQLNYQIGIISMTNSLENLPMWAYYANNFSGICLEFNAASLCLGDLFACGPYVVDYRADSLPYHDTSTELIDLLENHKQKNFLTKPIGWCHESEWRFLTTPGKNYYPRHALKRIWVGPRCSFSDWLVNFGREKNIEVKPLRSENFKLIEDGGSFQLPPNNPNWSNPIFDSFQKNYFLKNINTLNLNCINNLCYEFNRLQRRSEYALLSIDDINGEIAVKAKYRYSNDQERIFVEIYETDQFKSGNIYAEAAVPKVLIG
jgi:hypothetical protein